MVLGEINQSMTPFKDIHNDSYFNVPHEEVNIEDVSLEHLNRGFTDTLDTEIITSMYADNHQKDARGSTQSHSPNHRRKESNHQRDARGSTHSPNHRRKESNHQRDARGSTQSHSPSNRRKDSHVDRKSSAADKIKASHLWNRRSKNKKLELIIPNKNPDHNNTVDNAVVEAATSLGGDNRSSKKSQKMQRQSQVFKRGRKKLDVPDHENKVHGGSDISDDSRNSDSDTVTIDSALPSQSASAGDTIDAKSSLSPSTGAPQRQFSFSAAASAMNAFRKMIQPKEQNNNEEDENDSTTSKDEPSSAARRRWKMIFNVTKFEAMVRTPQAVDVVDESLFYHQNIKHPKTRNRLMRTFREGVDKLSRHGARRDSTDMDLKVGKSMLSATAGMYHTESEEDILERGLLGSTKLWIGKDYVNFIFKDFVNLDQPFEDFIDRTKYPRMPWHDVGCVLYGKSARDLARHFIGRWNFTKLEKCKRNPNFPLLIPKTLTNCTITRAIKDITFEVKAQVLRSCCGWSAGTGEVEYSIHEAYEHCIENSKNYIYIENQFFITQVGNHSIVHNGIGNALYKRILRAHRSSSNFKVYVVMPLLPAFEGEFGTNNGAALQAVTHWNYSSICRGGFSLMEKLAQVVPDPNKYIVFCGLRSWDRLDDKLFTELIYVHSKLMIVDDDTVIMGSANINDRSLLGTRDSEIAVMFEDIHKVDVTVNGKQYQAGKFASSLRWTIFREHLGINTDPDFVDLTDITVDSFYKDVWIKRAAVNTTCFDKVFKCLPTDNVKNYSQLREYQNSPPLAKTNEKEAMDWLKKVKGFLVLLPLQFLREEKLTPKVGQKEAMLPTHLWT